jgi:hypothetical protein
MSNRGNESNSLVTVECSEGSVTVPAETFIEALRRRIFANPEAVHITTDESLWVHTLYAASEKTSTPILNRR